MDKSNNTGKITLAINGAFKFLYIIGALFTIMGTMCKRISTNRAIRDNVNITIVNIRKVFDTAITELNGLSEKNIFIKDD
jgi:hypothetical protein